MSALLWQGLSDPSEPEMPDLLDKQRNYCWWRIEKV
jgi:hypothetical protein